MTQYYCPNCRRYVEGIKVFHGIIFTLLSLFVWFPGFYIILFLSVLSKLLFLIVLWLVWMSLPFFYVIYHVFGKHPRCPICNTKLGKFNSQTPTETFDRQKTKEIILSTNQTTNTEDNEKQIKRLRSEITDLQRGSFKVGQMEEEIENLKKTHEEELKEKDKKIAELNSLLKLKQRTETVTHAEYTTKYFPKFMLALLKSLDSSQQLQTYYVRYMKLFNYACVCGTGVLINMYVLGTMLMIFPWYMADFLAIIIAFFWNYTFTVGPLGYLFGLSPKQSKMEVANSGSG